MGELPNWVYDVVMQLQKWSDEHGNLFMLRHDGEYIRETECCRALHMVPEDVKKNAAVIANYKGQSCTCVDVSSLGQAPGTVLVPTGRPCPIHREASDG